MKTFESELAKELVIDIHNPFNWIKIESLKPGKVKFKKVKKEKEPKKEE